MNALCNVSSTAAQPPSPRRASNSSRAPPLPSSSSSPSSSTTPTSPSSAPAAARNLQNGVRRRSQRLVTAPATTTSSSSSSPADDGDDNGGDGSVTRGGGGGVGRRTLLAGTAGTAAASLVGFHGQDWSRCRCGGCAWAMAPLVDIPADKRAAFDPQRNAQQDALFANGMNSGMTGYERAVAARKKALFSQVFAQLAATCGAEATVVEVGMGTFPNAPYYVDPAVGGGGPGGSARSFTLDLVGVDPNDAMESFARVNLARAVTASSPPPSSSSTSSLRVVHGVAEALPLPSNSADAVVCTLTLCSVIDPAAAVAEIRRVLKPGAPFLFVEHVLSEDNPGLAAQQLRFNGLQMAMADGCHLDRRTLGVVNTAGFASVEAEQFTLPGFGLISSQVAGIAIA